MSQSLLSAKNLSHKYGESFVFKNLSLEIKSGDKIAIYGKNGAGKSTFLSILAGIKSAQEGTAKGAAGLRISYLFQDSNEQFIAPSVIEDVAFSLLAQGTPPKKAQDLAAKILDEFEISHLATRSIYTLSGGEKRMVAIAGVFVREADLYLLDEPFNELDEKKTALVLRRLMDPKLTFVMITHKSHRHQDLGKQGAGASVSADPNANLGAGAASSGADLGIDLGAGASTGVNLSANLDADPNPSAAPKIFNATHCKHQDLSASPVQDPNAGTKTLYRELDFLDLCTR